MKTPSEITQRGLSAMLGIAMTLAMIVNPVHAENTMPDTVITAARPAEDIVREQRDDWN